MSNKMRNQKINRLKSLSNNLDDSRLESLDVTGANGNVEDLDLTYSSYAFSNTATVVEPKVVEEEAEDVDSLVEYIKNVDAAFKGQPKVKKPSIAEQIKEKYKDTPKMKRSEMLCSYDTYDTFDLKIDTSKSSIDYYLDALDQVQQDD